MSKGIKDKVAILGMGCTRFGERWESDGQDLMVEAFKECIADAEIEKKQIRGGYLGTSQAPIHMGRTGLPLSLTLKLPNIPVTRVENACATGTEAFRAACYAVASGACDIGLGMGVEKLKDCGYGGLPAIGRSTESELRGPNITAPGMFAQLAAAYVRVHKLPMEKLKDAIAHVSVKSHDNGAMNPKAYLRNRVTEEQVKAAPMVAYPLGLFDCCGVSDGAACAIVTTPEIAKAIKPNQDVITVKSVQVSGSAGWEGMCHIWDGTYCTTTRAAAKEAYEEAGIKSPRDEITMFDVHDCFSITEFVTYEDLGISKVGNAYEDVMNGFYDLKGGGIPCQIDGGLKSFGHPIGATGFRMIYAMYEQLLDRVPEERKVKNANMGLTHNLGGSPWSCVAAISIIGRG